MRMKKIKFIMLFFLILFCCSACDGNVTRDIRHAGFSIGGEFVCNNFFPKDKDDTSYEKIKYLTGSHLINTEGKIYELSLGQTFANEENCKVADSNIIVKAIFDDKIIKASDNKYYYLVGQNNVASYSEVLQTDNSYRIYDLLLKGEDVVKVVTADSSTGLYYTLKSDGNIYGYTIASVDRNSPPVVTSTIVAYSKNDYGSNIVDFNYAGDSLNTFLKTENKMFRMKITNSDNCTKYADVKCEFQMLEDAIFETYKDRIIAYNGNMLITDYNKTFTVAN